MELWKQVESDFVVKAVSKDIYPLDEAIGLGKGERMTLGVRERSLWAAAEVSYEKSSKFLKKFTGLEVSRKKILAKPIFEPNCPNTQSVVKQGWDFSKPAVAR